MQPGLHGSFRPGNPPVFWPLTSLTGVVHMRRRVLYPTRSLAHSYRGIVPSFAHDHSPIPQRSTDPNTCVQPIQICCAMQVLAASYKTTYVALSLFANGGAT
jgi:hypothetical protein